MDWDLSKTHYKVERLWHFVNCKSEYIYIYRVEVNNTLAAICSANSLGFLRQDSGKSCMLFSVIFVKGLFVKGKSCFIMSIIGFFSPKQEKQAGANISGRICFVIYIFFWQNTIFEISKKIRQVY